MYNPPPNPENQPNQPNQPPYGTPGYGMPNQPPPPGQAGYGAPNQPPGYGAPNQAPPGYGAPNQAPPGYMPQQPAYGYGAPGAPMMPQRRRGMPAWAWVLIIGGLLGVFSCIGIFALGITLGINAVGDGQKVYQGFLSNAANGNTERAYAALSPSLKGQLSMEQFKTAFVDKAATFASIDSLDTTNFDASTTNGRSTLYFSGTAKFRERANTNYSVGLIKSGDSWLIDSFQIDQFSFGRFNTN